MKVKGDRLYLRPIDQSDAEIILEWENDPAVWEVSENDSPYQLSDIEGLIKELQDINHAKQARYIIVLSDSNRRIGTVDLAEIDFDRGIAWVGVLIADDTDRNKGYASEALTLVESIAASFNIQKLNAKIHNTNRASIHLFEKCEYQLAKKNVVEEKPQYIETEIYSKCLKR